MIGDTEYYDKKYPLGMLRIEGNSLYARNTTVPAMKHLSLALELIDPARGAPVILDIGANIGLTALLMDQTFQDARIFGFEPHPATFGQLSRNIKTNQTGRNTIELKQLALGTAPGELQFSNLSSANQGNSQVLGGTLAAHSHKDVISVPVARLDDLALAPDARINLIKIDVEGFELSVLEGAAQTLGRTDVMLMEFNHWCLSSMARIFPEDALDRVCRMFMGVYAYQHEAKRYARVFTPAQKWKFLHDNMVTNNVDDLLCTNDPSVIARLG